MKKTPKTTVAERARLEMHLLICGGCSNFRKQMDFLRTACRRYVESRSRDQE